MLYLSMASMVLLGMIGQQTPTTTAVNAHVRNESGGRHDAKSKKYQLRHKSEPRSYADVEFEHSLRNVVRIVTVHGPESSEGAEWPLRCAWTASVR